MLAYPRLPCRVYLCAREWENPLTGQVLDISDSSIPGSSSSSIPGSSGTGSSNGASRGGGGGIVKGPNLVQLHADGAASLADGSRLEGVDVVMYCTGYE